MGRIISGLIFFSIVSIVIFLLQLFITKQLSHLFGFRINLKVFMLIIGLSLFFIIGSALSGIYWSTLTQWIYVIANSYLGLIWLMFSTSLLYWITRFVIPNNKWLGYTYLTITLILFIFSLFNARSINITNLTINDAKISNPTRVALLTDVHIGAVQRENFLKKMVILTNEQKPDFIIFAGDLIDGSGTINKANLAPLKDLLAPAYFVYGNHEQYHGKADSTELIKYTPLNILENQIAELSGNIALVGIEHLSPNTRKNLPTILSNLKIDSNKYNIMLNHEPIDFLLWLDSPADIQLSGHIHNGQIFPFNLLNRLVYKQIYGLYENNGKQTFVSSGVGTWGPPMRLGSKSEIVIIDFQP